MIEIIGTALVFAAIALTAWGWAFWSVKNRLPRGKEWIPLSEWQNAGQRGTANRGMNMATGSYIGVPDFYALDMAAKTVADAFDSFGVFLVGSALERPDWRDIDLRMIMSDDVFLGLFPGAMIEGGRYAHHPRWILLTTTISEHFRKVTGLPVDFQIQPQSDATARFKKERQALGMRIERSP